jgi:hypothetical protein
MVLNHLNDFMVNHICIEPGTEIHAPAALGKLIIEELK